MIKTIYVIAGPTATGKSEFSIELAKKVNGTVVNSDSMQVYKNLKILTARPSRKEMKNGVYILKRMMGQIVSRQKM